jgi:hypothetical protein
MWARISLYIGAIVFLGLGLMSLVAAGNLTPLVEIVMPTAVAVMEIRGVYGGFFFGTGLFLWLFARRDSWLQPGLVALASIFGGFVLGRVLGIMIGGAPNLFIGGLLAGEIIGLVVVDPITRARSLRQSRCSPARIMKRIGQRVPLTRKWAKTPLIAG